ncbi:MAG TPA: uracil-DNA glycosylase [Patescibacteria group bacterium]
MDVRINPQWKNELRDTFNKDYWKNLTSQIRDLYLKTSVYPKPNDIFRAFDLCPFEKVKVVILGQDPYHGKGQANGLCFSVNEGIALPPSLKNIYKEIHNDLRITPNPSGDLSRWAKQGVLLLNSVLTVLANKPASHAGIGWEKFTDEAIQKLSQNKKHVVYMLWGKYAQKKGEIIDRGNNLVLASGHPSPFSEKLFFGNHHFSKCNTYLEEHGLSPIDWH